jgi:transmembrane sensor
MMLPPARRLSRYVEPTLDGKRIDRGWAGVSARRVSTWSARRMAAPAAAGFALAAALLLVVRGRTTAPAAPVAGMVLESGEGRTMTLADGSSAVLGHDARLRFDRIESSRVEATVERGEATFEVRHSATRTWTVHAREFDVIDRGTRFDVAVSDTGVSVRVESGSVEVIHSGASGGGRRLEGGESWTSGSPPVVPPAEAPTPEASASVTPTATVSPTTAPMPAAPGPRELLETANAARLAGHPREAAQAFDTIRTRFRGDARAGLAAFELGRLRLDALGDPAGAVAAFDDAIVLAPHAGFREDAEARRVEALDRMHDARCPAARQAFLARYPNGLHTASVAARCP